MADSKKPTYKQHPESIEAVEIFNELRQIVLDKYPKTTVAVMHLAACLFEEACNRCLPFTEDGDRIVKTARLIAPGIVNDIAKEDKAKRDGNTDNAEDLLSIAFSMKGNDEIN